MEEFWKNLTILSSQPGAAAAADAAATTSAAGPPLCWLAHQEFLAAGSWEKDTISDAQTDDQRTNISKPAGSCACPSRKRGLDRDENGGGDQKKKPLVKNRESAVRSRARKQAYTHELEAMVAHLEEENAKLKKQVKDCPAALGHQHEKKHKLFRTLTAPF